MESFLRAFGDPGSLGIRGKLRQQVRSRIVPKNLDCIVIPGISLSRKPQLESQVRRCHYGPNLKGTDEPLLATLSPPSGLLEELHLAIFDSCQIALHRA